MRKGSLKIIEKAKNSGFNENLIKYLTMKEPSLTIDELETAYEYLRSGANVDDYERIKTVEKYIHHAFSREILDSDSPDKIAVYFDSGQNPCLIELFKAGIPIDIIKEIEQAASPVRYIEWKLLRLPRLIQALKEGNRFAVDVTKKYFHETDQLTVADSMIGMNCGLPFSDFVSIIDRAKAEGGDPIRIYNEEYTKYGAIKNLILKIYGIAVIKENYFALTTLNSRVFEPFIKSFPGSSMEIEYPAESVRVYFNPKAINIYFENSHYIQISRTGEIPASKGITVLEIVVFPDGGMYQKIKSGRLVPLSLKKLYSMENCYMDLFRDEYIKYMSGMNPFFNDLAADSRMGFNIPVSLNELSGIHSRAELINKYAITKRYSRNWNRLNLNYSYFIIKVIPYVDEKSRQILLNMTDKDFRGVWPNIMCFRKAEPCALIYHYLKNKVSEPKDESIIADYIDMARALKIKISLHTLTMNGVHKMHDELRDAMLIKAARNSSFQVSIPQKSQFAKLDGLLVGFERIRTKKRLIDESVMLHHCVASLDYASRINHDKCAIYSFYDASGAYSQGGKSERFTVEIIKSKGKYKIRQIRGLHNHDPKPELFDYVNSLISV